MIESKQAANQQRHARIYKSLHEAFPIISPATERELRSRNLLSFPSLDHWRLGDGSNGVTRSFSSRKHKHSENAGTNWHRLIGLDDVTAHNRKFVVFVIEGATDALASLELAHRAGLSVSDIGIVAGQGSGYRPIGEEIERLRGRKVLVIGDRDTAGMETVALVSRKLMEHDIDHVVLNWRSFDPADGKDLFDLLMAIDRQKTAFGESLRPLFSFFSPPF